MRIPYAPKANGSIEENLRWIVEISLRSTDFRTESHPVPRIPTTGRESPASHFEAADLRTRVTSALNFASAAPTPCARTSDRREILHAQHAPSGITQRKCLINRHLYLCASRMAELHRYALCRRSESLDWLPTARCCCARRDQRAPPPPWVV